ncbi:PspC domain-containing protein [Secundilactobacillus kimchicus]|uniref:PspC domain-containing protein n=1 Tax=Secundilactobacillus kimchicus TaxID=528209 RepID=UPI00352164DE
MKGLYRSKTNCVFTGALGGMAEKFGCIANRLRIVWSILPLTPFRGWLFNYYSGY